MSKTKTSAKKIATLVTTLRVIADRLDLNELQPKAALDAANVELAACGAEEIKRQKNAAALVKRLRAEADLWGETIADVIPATPPDGFAAMTVETAPESEVTDEQIAADADAFTAATADVVPVPTDAPVAPAEAPVEASEPAEPEAAAEGNVGAPVEGAKAKRLAALLAGEKPAPVVKRPKASITFVEAHGQDEGEQFAAKTVRAALALLSTGTRAILQQIAIAYSGGQEPKDDDALLDVLHGRPCPQVLRTQIDRVLTEAQGNAVLRAPKGGAPREGSRVTVILRELQKGATVPAICAAMAEAFPTFTARHGGGATTPESFDAFVRTAISHLHGGRNFSVATLTKGKINRAKNAAGEMVYTLDPSVDLTASTEVQAAA